jgi:hypothetical protein
VVVWARIAIEALKVVYCRTTPELVARVDMERGAMGSHRVEASNTGTTSYSSNYNLLYSTRSEPTIIIMPEYNYYNVFVGNSF